MITALTLALGQLGDRRILRILGKSIALTVLVLAGLGWLAWLGLDQALLRAGAHGPLAGFAAALLAVIGAWLLFRLVALVVLQFFGDEVVAAVEQRHYPDAAVAARPLGWRAELALGLGALLRSLGYNLVALPVALVLVVTGIGPALVFGLVNAVLLGRELDDMVRLRHRDAGGLPLARSPGLARFGLGAVVTGLMLVPFVQFLAPVVGAAMATHLVHRREAGYGARP